MFSHPQTFCLGAICIFGPFLGFTQACGQLFRISGDELYLEISWNRYQS